MTAMDSFTDEFTALLAARDQRIKELTAEVARLRAWIAKDDE